VHGPEGCVQLQFVPLIPVIVSPDGGASLTVTVFPAVFAALPLFVTVTVYVAPLCPCAKSPLCVFVIVRSGSVVE